MVLPAVLAWARAQPRLHFRLTTREGACSERGRCKGLGASAGAVAPEKTEYIAAVLIPRVYVKVAPAQLFARARSVPEQSSDPQTGIKIGKSAAPNVGGVGNTRS